MSWWEKAAEKLGLFENDDYDEDDVQDEIVEKDISKETRIEQFTVHSKIQSLQNMQKRDIDTKKSPMTMELRPEDVEAIKNAGGKKGFGFSSNEELDAVSTLARALHLVVFRPSTFEDCDDITRILKEADRPMLVNFDKTDPVVAKRISDYISGVVYALHGEMKKLGTSSMLLSANRIDIDMDV